MKLAQKSILRIKNILKQDKESVPEPMLNMIKNDILSLLCNYMDLTTNRENINLVYYVDDNGKYNFELKLQASRIKKANFF